LKCENKVEEQPQEGQMQRESAVSGRHEFSDDKIVEMIYDQN
jgi:hypothetical protein